MLEEKNIVCPSGGIGRHKGLKILDRNIVPVQVRPRVPLFRAFVISINQLEHSEPYKIFIEKYHEALKLKQKHIEAVCIGSYSPEIKEVSSRYVNLKYIENNKWILQIIILLKQKIFLIMNKYRQLLE